MQIIDAITNIDINAVPSDHFRMNDKCVELTCLFILQILKSNGSEFENKE